MSDKQPVKNLAEQVMARLSADIRGGRLAPGARLPTEQALTTELGVSRTVVREAVAALRADGLVVTRRGSGAYVADPAAGPFRIVPPRATSLADILNVMNLLNHDWGTGVRFYGGTQFVSQPLIIASAAQGGAVSPTGAPQYTMRVQNGALINKTFEPTAAISDVYRIQFALKYNFN